MINYKHLHYFWVVAKSGGITRASERLHLTPQTISGQLSLLEEHLGETLFSRVGRNLELTETGRLVLSYAEEIFSLGNELKEMLKGLPEEKAILFNVGGYGCCTEINCLPFIITCIGIARACTYCL